MLQSDPWRWSTPTLGPRGDEVSAVASGQLNIVGLG
jgi:hypothetical protein